MAPTLFIVPGSWEGPGSFEPLVAALRSTGHQYIFTTKLVSTGRDSKSGPPPSMDDDIAAIAADLTRVVGQAGPDGVVMLMHSVAGLLGSGAMKGLDASTMEASGKSGGVKKLIFFTAAAAPEATEHKTPPFFEIDEETGTATCRDPLHNLFNDFTPEAAQEWMQKMSYQPAYGWSTTVRYCGWREVPSVYIIAEDDNVIPPPLQEKLAAMAGSKVVRMKGGHMAHISQTQELAKLVGEVL